VTLNLLKGSTADLVETILHEMTHTTLYLKGQGEFNEGLAGLVGKVGAVRFLEETYGPSDPLTIEAKKNLEDERIFSAFLSHFLEELDELYGSSLSYQEKLAKRETVFAKALRDFGQLRHEWQTNRFIYFEGATLNNAYLMIIGLYHRHFHLFEAVLKENGDSVRETLSFFRDLAKREGDILENARAWLAKQTSPATSLIHLEDPGFFDSLPGPWVIQLCRKDQGMNE
jgi:predicted aminopeptidase